MLWELKIEFDGVVFSVYVPSDQLAVANIQPGLYLRGSPVLDESPGTQAAREKCEQLRAARELSEREWQEYQAQRERDIRAKVAADREQERRERDARRAAYARRQAERAAEIAELDRVANAERAQANQRGPIFSRDAENAERRRRQAERTPRTWTKATPRGFRSAPTDVSIRANVAWSRAYDEAMADGARSNVARAAGDRAVRAILNAAAPAEPGKYWETVSSLHRQYDEWSARQFERTGLADPGECFELSPDIFEALEADDLVTA